MTFGSAFQNNNDVQGNRGFDVAANGALIVNRNIATHPAVNVVFTIGAEVSNVRNLSLQFRNANKRNIAEEVMYDLFVFAGASLALASTGGSTGIADGGAGSIFQTVVAKMQFRCLTNAAGLSEFTWTDTGNESVRLGVKLPNGNVMLSSAFANAL
jgi:hypothetical protein